MQDLRFALRVLARSPGFTAVVVLILGLGIGANTTIFSLVSALMLRPIPGVADPGSLVMVRGVPGDLGYPDLVDFRTGARSLSQLAGVKPWAMDVRVGDETRRVRGALVSSNYFAVLGVTPALGRVFVAEEESGTPGGHPVVVLGHALWRDRLGADPGVVGRTIGINGRPFSIIGVAPEGFHGVQLIEADELARLAARLRETVVLDGRELRTLLLGGAALAALLLASMLYFAWRAGRSAQNFCGS